MQAQPARDDNVGPRQQCLGSGDLISLICTQCCDHAPKSELTEHFQTVFTIYSEFGGISEIWSPFPLLLGTPWGKHSPCYPWVFPKLIIVPPRLFHIMYQYLLLWNRGGLVNDPCSLFVYWQLSSSRTCPPEIEKAASSHTIFISDINRISAKQATQLVPGSKEISPCHVAEETSTF